MMIKIVKLKNNYCNLYLFLCIYHAGGFGGNIGHDPHVLYTLSAVQVLALFDKLDVLDIEKVSNCILWRMNLFEFWHQNIAHV